jgi:hypothetical protein
MSRRRGLAGSEVAAAVTVSTGRGAGKRGRALYDQTKATRNVYDRC